MKKLTKIFSLTAMGLLAVFAFAGCYTGGGGYGDDVVRAQQGWIKFGTLSEYQIANVQDATPITANHSNGTFTLTVPQGTRAVEVNIGEMFAYTGNNEMFAEGISFSRKAHRGGETVTNDTDGAIFRVRNDRLTNGQVGSTSQDFIGLTEARARQYPATGHVPHFEYYFEQTSAGARRVTTYLWALDEAGNWNNASNFAGNGHTYEFKFTAENGRQVAFDVVINTAA